MKKNIIIILASILFVISLFMIVGLANGNSSEEIERYQCAKLNEYLAPEVIDEIGETTITRVEQQERTVERKYWSWWVPVGCISIDNSISNIFEPKEKEIKSLTIEKIATKVNGVNIEKKDGKNITKVKKGDIIEYEIKITNTGNTVLENITVKDSLKVTVDNKEKDIDPKTSVSTIAVIPSLSFKENMNTKTIVTYYTVTEDDAKKDELKNIATATVPGGPSGKSEEVVPVEPEIPEILEQKGTVTVKGEKSSIGAISTPMDVVFVLDTSGSMAYGLSDTVEKEDSRAKAMINAVNTSIKTIMSKNSDSRIGVVGFSKDYSTIIPLEKYSQTEDYLTINYKSDKEDSIQTIVSNVGDKKSRIVNGGTNTQEGIKSGAEMLINAKDKKYVTKLNEKEVSVTRTPVLILVTDGEPTYYHKSEKATGKLNGDGGAWIKTNENYYYWTIKTAKYYKDQITSKYYEGTQSKSKVFTIGIGINGNNAKAMLKPDETNVKACDTKLYNLLNSAGNPYAYDYADATKTGSLTEGDIKDFLITSINQSEEISNVRDITEDEAKSRKIVLTDIDVDKEFELSIGDKKYVSVDIAKDAGYLKLDSKNAYYVDLSGVDGSTNVCVVYWKK